MSRSVYTICLMTLFLHAAAQLPPESVMMFMENVVSTNLNERDMALSPDGVEMFYTIQASQHAMSTIITRKKLSNNNWSQPSVATFSGRYSDLEPAFSADGKKLYFSSNRPTTGDTEKDYDIWMIEKVNGQWSIAKNIGAPVNTGANEFFPSVGASGNLYFTGEYENGVGKEDIYVSAWKNGVFASPVPLDTAVNSKLWEFNAFVTFDEQFIVFTHTEEKMIWEGATFI